jgi:antigen flippase
MSMQGYGRIVSAASLMGGAAAAAILLGIVRAKFAAILIGPAGVGMVANFTAMAALAASISSLGIQTSAVRDAAGAHAREDQQALARIGRVIRRLCWLTGLAGAVAMVVLSGALSKVSFGSQDFQLQIAALGLAVMLGNATGAYSALMQGSRRIGDLALAQLWTALIGTAIAIACYASLGVAGIVPSLIAIAAVQFAIARRFAGPAGSGGETSWPDTWRIGRGIVALGIALMWAGLLTNATSYAVTALITKQSGLAATGLYSAAYGLSAMLVSFILGAMAADYYPQLSAMAPDAKAMNRLVNQQTEIAVLLTLPGMLIALAFAPWLIRALYSVEFLPAVDVLRWFILGCLGQVISWPLGFVMLALNKRKWFLATETAAQLLYVVLALAGLLLWGPRGVAIAFCIMYATYTAIVFFVGKRLTGFSWSAGTQRVIWLAVSSCAICVSITLLSHAWQATLAAAGIAAAASFLCLRGIMRRLGPEYRIVRAASKIPGMKRLIGH